MFNMNIQNFKLFSELHKTLNLKLSLLKLNDNHILSQLTDQ